MVNIIRFPPVGNKFQLPTARGFRRSFVDPKWRWAVGDSLLLSLPFWNVSEGSSGQNFDGMDVSSYRRPIVIEAVSNAKPALSRRGRCIDFNNSGWGIKTPRIQLGVAGETKFTIAAVFESDVFGVGSNNDYILKNNKNTGQGYGLHLADGILTAEASTNVLTSSALTLGVTYAAIWTFDEAGDTGRLVISGSDGSFQNIFSSSLTAVYNNGTGNPLVTWVGGRDNGDVIDGRIYCANLWKEFFSEQQCFEWVNDPFGMFRMSSMYFVSAAVAPVGAGALIFNPFSVAAIGEQPHEGVGALTMTAEDLVAVGEQPYEAVGALTLEAMALAAVGVMQSSDVKVSVQSAALSTSGTGTTDLTKAGFGTPKACKIIVSFDTTDDTGVAAQSRVSIGFSDFTNHRCITHQDEDASAKVDCDALKSATKAYVILDAAGVVIIDGTVSTITDGVRLTNTTNTNSDAPFVTVEMFGGADLVDDLRSTTINSTQDGTATITHAGLTDGNEKLIFFIGTDVSGEDSASTGINSAYGVCHISGNDAGGYTFTQRCIGWASDHNNNVGSPFGIITTDRVLDILTETGGQDWGLEVTAFSSSGGTITVTTRDAGAGAGMEVYSLIIDLKDLKAKVGSVDSPTSGATWTPSVSLGFTPQCVGLGLTWRTVEDTVGASDQAGVFGVSSNTGSGEETCHSWYNEDAALETNTNNLFRSRVIDLRDDDVTTVVQDHSHSSFDSGGWTYTINTENETAARKWFYWAIEEVGVSAPTGTSAPTLELFAVACVGEQPHEGTSILTIEIEELVAVGVMQPSGTGVPTLEIEELVAVGVEKFLATGVPTMELLELAAVGVQEFLGTGALVMEIEELVAAGAMQPSGTSTPTLEIEELVAVGQVPFEGVGALVMEIEELAAVGQVPFEGVGALVMEIEELVSSGAMQPSGTGTPTLEIEELVAVGVQKFIGTGALTLEIEELAAVGVQKFLGIGALVMEIEELVAVGEQPHEGVGAPTLEIEELVAVGAQKFLGTGALTMEIEELVAAGSAGEPEGVGALTLEIEELAAVGLMEADGTGTLTLEIEELAAVGVGAAAAGSLWPPMRRRRRPGR